MKTQKQISGKFGKGLLIVVAVMGMILPSAWATDILYNFDNPGDTGSVAIDSLTGDGSQNAVANYSGWVLTPNSGPGIHDGTTSALFGTSYGNLQTAAIISYPSAMTWSAAINLTAPTFDNGSLGTTTLFWAGWKRGVGETHFYINPNGSLSWQQGGGATRTTTATGLITSNVWQALGITFDSSVGGGTLTFYTNGLALQAFTGVGALVGFGNGGGTAGQDSETIFGQMYNVTGTSQFFGLADNIFMANRALSASEMFTLEEIHTPEPTTMALLGLGGLLALRRHRKK